MQVLGEAAKGWIAVRLDTFEQVNTGPLVEADDYLGIVRWLDRTGAVRSEMLGAQAIRILRRSSYGR